LRCAQLTACEANAAQAAVASRHNPHQARTSRWPQCLRGCLHSSELFVQSVTRSVSRGALSMPRPWRARHVRGIGTPRPMLACTKNSGRQVSWLAGRRPYRPSQSKPVAVGCGLAAYNCGGSHSFAVFPVRPVRAPTNRGIMPVFAAAKAHRHQAGRALTALQAWHDQ
jgi:hypothetical protein